MMKAFYLPVVEEPEPGCAMVICACVHRKPPSFARNGQSLKLAG
jgi:hypothetical protein